MSTNILNPLRLKERIQIWSQICFPSVCSQTSPNFDWIIIIDPLLPSEIRTSMLNIIQTHYDSSSYSERGPRNIILHNWCHLNDQIGKVDWVLKELGENNSGLEYLITTRLDDDDALNRKFVKVLQKQVRDTVFIKPSDKLCYFSYPSGYYMNLDKHHIMKKKVHMIAIGLSLVTRLKFYPISVYLGDHTKIPFYIRHPENLPDLYHFYKTSDDIHLKPEKTRQRLKVIAHKEPMWIRTIHNHNLQHNIKKIPNSIGMKSSSEENLKFLSNFFDLKLIPLKHITNFSFSAPNHLPNKHKKIKLSKPRIKYLGKQ